MHKIWLLIIFLGFYSASVAQEICGNGLDDDNNGKVDCFDPACANKAVCDDSFVGQDKDCQVEPPAALNFQMTLAHRSSQSTPVTTSFDRIVVGDLDGDGYPEVVTPNYSSKKVYILDGRDLTTKKEITPKYSVERYDVAIGRVTSGKCASIFIATKNSGRYYIEAFDCEGKPLSTWGTPNYKQVHGRPYDLGLADFNQDGKVELYYRNEIMDAETGTILIPGTGTWTDEIDAGPVAADILSVTDLMDNNNACADCGGLELVAGGLIYAVKITNRNGTTGNSRTLARSINTLIPNTANKYYPFRTDCCGESGLINSQTSIADFNQDGYLDVLMNGATGANKYTASRINGTNPREYTQTGEPTIFYWDVKNKKYFTYKPKQVIKSGDKYGLSWDKGTGRINIADLDNDPQGVLDITFVSGNQLYALAPDFVNNKFVEKWKRTIDEESSGFTSTTVFDFNNDNAAEIVYRDESQLMIIRGTDGSDYTTIPCVSQTTNEYPVVVDVDNDGATEICVTCALNDNPANVMSKGEVRMYKSAHLDDPWVPARKVWNQHAYFNVNVNDDLSIPKVQQKHHIVFEGGNCATGENRALNTFLNQSAILDSKGCKTYPAPDIVFEPDPVDLIKITPPTCPDKDFKVSFKLRNQGNVAMNGTLPIAFYSGDPRVAGSQKIDTLQVILKNFEPGQVKSIVDATISGTGKNFTLYAVLNDDGTTALPFASGVFPNSAFNECTYSNNVVSAAVNPNTFPLTLESSDHFQCGAAAITGNGHAEAYKLENGVKVTAGFTFYWFDSQTVGDTVNAVYKGPVRNQLLNGDYSVVAYHNAYRCASAPNSVTIGLEEREISAVVTAVHDFTNCVNPDGVLAVKASPGSPEDYTYQWFIGTVFGTSPILSVNDTLFTAEGFTYSVLVKEIATNCETIEPGTVVNNTVKPAISATATPADCVPAESGTATANSGGTTIGYTFLWYDGETILPSPNFTGNTYDNLTAGSYTVVARNNTTGCKSDPFIVEVGSPTGFSVTATRTAQQTSCADPNGAASASVGGTTTGFTFKWFSGNNTLPANQLPQTASTITGLAAGTYTVLATRVADGCTDTDIVVIEDQIQDPTVTASVVSHQTFCSPFNGVVNASTTAAGTHDFYWFNGSAASDTTLRNHKGATYSGIAAGSYTVVAVNRYTRCFSDPATVTVNDQTQIPAITATPVSQTNCDPAFPNGSASASVSTPAGTYKFRWFTGSDTTTFISQGTSITNRAAGTFTVKTVNLTTGCISTSPVSIVNNFANPTVAATSTIDNMNCSGATPNGSIVIEVSGGANPLTDYTIQWFEGNGTTTALGTTTGDTGGSNNEIAEQLIGGTYTVKVTDNVSPGRGCAVTSSFSIINSPPTISIANANISTNASTNCSPGNGSATVTAVTGPGSLSDYTFTWLESDGVTPIASAGTSNSINGLAPGNYFVRATNTDNNCESAQTSFTINDNHVNPAITAATLANNENCSGASNPSGQVTINVGGSVPTAGQFQVEWFAGNGTTTALASSKINGPNNETARFLGAGSYTVRVTDTSTPNQGCVSVETFTIIDNPATISIANADIDITDNTNCSPGNGSAEITALTGPGSIADYTFEWLQGDGVTAINNAGNGAVLALAAEVVGGSYYVRATNNTTQCSSVLTPFTIADNHPNPAVTAASLNDNENCPDAQDPSGQITINVDGSVPVAGQFLVEWFAGNGTTTALASSNIGGPNNEIAQLLGAGSYTVRVTDTSSPRLNCVTVKTFTIIDDPATISIANADIDITDNTNCNPGNGSAEVTALTGPGGIGDYTFEWLQSDGVTPINNAGNGAVLALAAQVMGGSYFVKATNTTTACASVLTPFTINDAPVVPVITEANNDDNTICDIVNINPDGSLTIDINGGADPSEFTVEWFRGTGTAVALNTPAITSGVNNEIASGLSAGKYTVRVTDNVAPAEGCITTKTFTIVDNLTLPAPLNTTPFDNTACDPAKSNGEIQADVGGATAGIQFDFFKGQNTLAANLAGTPVVTAAEATIGSLVASTYTVRATIVATGCFSTDEVTIGNNIVLPTLAATPQDVTICTDPANGVVTASIANGIGVLSDYTFTWYTGKQVLAAPSFTVTGNILNNSAGDNITAGFYTVFAHNNTLGCDAQAPVTVYVDYAPSTAIAMNEIPGDRQVPSVCNDGTGQMGVNAASAGGSGFIFEWFKGDKNLGMLSIGNGLDYPTDNNRINQAIAGGIDINSGRYTIIAIDNFTGCQDSLVIDLPYNDEATLLTIHTTDHTHCSVPDGTIEIQVQPGPGTLGIGGLDQSWYRVDAYQNGVLKGSQQGTVGASIGDPIVIMGLPTGEYTVVAVETEIPPLVGCLSQSHDVIINDSRDFPVVVDHQLESNKHCIGATEGNGLIELNVDGNAGAAIPSGDFTFAWYAGQIAGTGPLAGSKFPDGHTALSLTGGFYTVEVTNTSNDCETVETFHINDEPYTITSTPVLAHQTDCSPFDGSAEVTTVLLNGVNPGAPITDYDFAWYRADGTTTFGGNLSAVGTLSAGKYFVKIEDNTTTNCDSDLISFEILDQTPEITINYTTTPNRICNPAGTINPDGSVNIEILANAAGEDEADYTITWTTLDAQAQLSVNKDEALQVVEGTYNVHVVKTAAGSVGLGCEAEVDIEVKADKPLIAINTFALTHDTNCLPVGNGTAEVTDVLVRNVSAPLTDFTFTWKQNNGAVIGGSGTGATMTGMLNHHTLAYKVNALHGPSNCVSPDASFVILDKHVDPTLVSTTAPNRMCDAGSVNPDGEVGIEIMVNGAGETETDYTITWTTLNAAAVLSADNASATVVDDGTYHVHVIKDHVLNSVAGAGCEAEANITVLPDKPLIAVNTFTLTHDTNCLPVGNGTAEVTDVLVRNVSAPLTDFTFTWKQNNGAVIGGSGTGATMTGMLNHNTYKVSVLHVPSNCVSPDASFVILDKHVDPTLVSTTIPNRICDDGSMNPDGEVGIEIMANGAGETETDYTITWTTLNVAAVLSADNASATVVDDGTYHVHVIKDLVVNSVAGAGCEVEADITVLPDKPVIAISKIDLTHDRNCGTLVSGSAEVTELLVRNIATTSVGDFVFTWQNNTIGGTGNNALIGVALDDGNYVVRALHSASNCVSPDLPFTILDNSVTPALDATIVTNTICYDATHAPNGQISLQLRAGSTIESASDYTITWTGIPAPVVYSANNDVASQVTEGGPYHVHAIKTAVGSVGEGCEVDLDITVDHNKPLIAIDRISLTPDTDCAPFSNGSATVTRLLVDNDNSQPVNAFSYVWQNNTIGGAGNTETIQVPLTEGSYVVRALHIASNCESFDTPFLIEDRAVVPAISILETMPNIACNTDYTGAIAASVTEGTTQGVTTNYTFEWFAGNNTSGASIGSTPTLSGLQEGAYTVRVTDTASPNRNCDNTATLAIRFAPTNFASEIVSVDQTSCAPLQEGSLTVNTITETVNGVATSYNMTNAAHRALFSFQWFDENPAALTGVVNGQHEITGQLAGQYYVQITNGLGCTSTLSSGVIADETVAPYIKLEDFTNPTVCVLPETPGRLVVSANNDPFNNTDYTFEWFEGANTSGTLMEANNQQLAGIMYNQPSEYTVRVTTLATNCFSTKTYTLATDTIAIRAMASAQPLTNCVDNNGQLFAAVQQGAGPLYNFEWYAGTVDATPEFTTKEVATAPLGKFIVIARHPTLTFCPSIPDTTVVQDGRKYPDVDIEIKHALTYCDPANPNGVAKATVNGDVIGYTFDWYRGNVTGSPFYVGSEVSGLHAELYTVNVVDAVSGCATAEPVNIPNDPVKVPMPTVLVESHRTHCDIQDGALSANVNGTLINYTIQWYNGSSVRNQTDSEGEFYRDLAEGLYTTTATDVISGCVSDPVVTEVLPIMVYPEFNLELTPTHCDADIGEAFYVALNDVTLRSVQWKYKDFGGIIWSGVRMSSMAKGEYTVIATTDKNCVTEKDFWIKPDVLVYNGVSPNNDGNNDIFEISCIEDFENNVVKIFNRAGTLVYQARGYNNTDIYFDGRSNEGINLLGRDLPDGTYFYIIDKNDGSVPKTGYLELLRQ